MCIGNLPFSCTPHAVLTVTKNRSAVNLGLCAYLDEYGNLNYTFIFALVTLSKRCRKSLGNLSVFLVLC